jgi:hypothetical protein
MAAKGGFMRPRPDVTGTDVTPEIDMHLQAAFSNG